MNVQEALKYSTPTKVKSQEAKYVERWQRLLPGLAGADLIFQWIGMVEYIPS
jgi:hypothetical protein